MANTPKDVLIDRIRRKLRDFENKNLLLDNELESESEDISEALQSGLEVFNTAIMPPSSYSLDSFPVVGYIHLIHLAIIELLITNSILSSRNRLVYSDGKIGGIDTESKAGPYAEWATRLTQLWERRAMTWKSSMNIAQVGDGIPSDYSSLVNDEEEF